MTGQGASFSGAMSTPLSSGQERSSSVHTLFADQAVGDVDAWIVHPERNPHTRLRLFCFPHAGAGASLFYDWPRHLPPQVEIYPVQLPGRENRYFEPAFTRLLPLARELALQLLPYLNKPFALFGHSMGALIGFEVVRQLRRQNNLLPVCLFVSGSRAPQMPARLPLLHLLPDSVLVEELRRLGGTPEPVLQNAELMRLMLPLLRSDLAVYETYEFLYEEPLGCPIYAFGGSQDPVVGRYELAAWRDQTHSRFGLRMLPGDHFFSRSALTCLLHALRQDLTQLLGTTHG